jgi:hypothetical protein
VIDLCRGTMIATETGKGDRTVFEWDPDDYSPGLHACRLDGEARDLAECDDLIGFARAYAEDGARGAEFDRDPDAAEQLHAEFWSTHGDSFELETGGWLEV